MEYMNKVASAFVALVVVVVMVLGQSSEVLAETLYNVTLYTESTAGEDVGEISFTIHRGNKQGEGREVVPSSNEPITLQLPEGEYVLMEFGSATHPTAYHHISFSVIDKDIRVGILALSPEHVTPGYESEFQKEGVDLVLEPDPEVVVEVEVPKVVVPKVVVPKVSAPEVKSSSVVKSKVVPAPIKVDTNPYTPPSKSELVVDSEVVIVPEALIEDVGSTGELISDSQIPESLVSEKVATTSKTLEGAVMMVGGLLIVVMVVLARGIVNKYGDVSEGGSLDE